MNALPQNRSRIIVAFALLYVLWGSTYLAMRVIVRDMPPYVAGAVRYLAAGPIMLAACALGFNAMWKTGGAAYDAIVKRALGLDPADAIVGFLYLGTEAARAATPLRGEWRDLVREWPDPQGAGTT